MLRSSPSMHHQRNELIVLGKRNNCWSRWIRALRAEDGQSLVLAIGLCAITLLTISVVLAASAVNLKARQLLSVADGAIVAAVDEFEFVASDGQPRIELSHDQVQAAVRSYLQDVDANQRIDNLRISSVQILSDGQGATLTLSGSAQPPIIGWIVPSGVSINVNSTARTVLSR